MNDLEIELFENMKNFEYDDTLDCPCCAESGTFNHILWCKVFKSSNDDNVANTIVKIDSRKIEIDHNANVNVKYRIRELSKITKYYCEQSGREWLSYEIFHKGMIYTKKTIGEASEQGYF